MLARTSVPMFQSKVVQWIAPDHLLTIKSKQQKEELECHASQLVAMLVRKRVSPVDTVLVRDIRGDKPTVYLRLLGAPEEYSHLYMPVDLVEPLHAPCPPFDELDLIDTVMAAQDTKVESMKRV